MRKRVQYSLDNAAYGNQQFSFLTGNGTYFRFCLITFVLGIAVYRRVIFAVLHVGLSLGFRAPTTGIEVMALSASAGWVLISAASSPCWASPVTTRRRSPTRRSAASRPARNTCVRTCAPGRSSASTCRISFAIVFTLGLFYPWAKVRQVRYQLENTAIDSDGNLAAFTASSGEGIDAVGEEVGDFFDVDFGI